jgi:hypothetical protein
LLRAFKTRAVAVGSTTARNSLVFQPSLAPRLRFDQLRLLCPIPQRNQMPAANLGYDNVLLRPRRILICNIHIRHNTEMIR